MGGENFEEIKETKESSSSSKTAETVQIAAKGLYKNLAYDAKDTTMCFNAHLKASSIKEIAPNLSEEKSRKPVDLTLILDKSGSMSGEKLRLCKETILFLQKELQAKDRLSVVSYDTDVYLDLPLTKQDAEGKKLLREKVSKISPGSMTNLSGGLCKGLQVMKEATADVRSVILLTDGLVNHGITDHNQILRLVEGLRQPGTSVFTFGYGSDHNDDLLRKISDKAEGMYYYIEDVDQVPIAFADCIGGLLSVVAQNLQLTIKASEGVKITTVRQDKSKVTCVKPNQEYQINLGDMYAEESRDILVDCSLPVLTSPDKDSNTPVLQYALEYVDVFKTRLQTANAFATLDRTKSSGDLTKGTPDTHILEQLSRLEIADALEVVRDSGNRGDMEKLKSRIAQTHAKLEHNCFLSPQLMQSPMYNSMVEEFKEVERSCMTASMYRSSGKYMANNCAQSHFRQRSNKSRQTNMYKNAKKKMMCSRSHDLQVRSQNRSAPTSTSSIFNKGFNFGNSNTNNNNGGGFSFGGFSMPPLPILSPSNKKKNTFKNRRKSRSMNKKIKITTQEDKKQTPTGRPPLPPSLPNSKTLGYTSL